MTGWASLLGGLGLVGIAFGLLIALISAFQPVADLSWVWGNLVIGAVLLGSAVASSFDTLRERARSGEGRRAGKYGSSALLSTLLGIAILGMLGFLSTRYSARFDWSEQKVHTLTDQSLKVLGGLEADVQVTAFFNELAAPGVRDLLERYAHASPHFSLEFADPNVRPDLVETYHLDASKLANGLVRLAVGPESLELSEFSEAKVTNALVQLSRGSEKKIYFLAGHSERAVEGEGSDGKEGFQLAAEALRNENYRVESLLLPQVGAVPGDADVLVIAGPTRPLPAQEQSAIADYLDGGGALLVLLDPRANTNISDLTAGWGVRFGEDVVVDLELAFFQQYMSPFAGAYSASHPITQEMGKQRDPTLFHLARSVELEEGAASDFETIVFTGDKSWAERDLNQLFSEGRFGFDPGDGKGPVPIAAAGTVPAAAVPSDGDDQSQPGEPAPPARVVLVGDSDFATNELMVRYGGNRDLFVNSINWLLGDIEAISVRPHQSRASRFVGSQDEVRAIQYLSLFVLPEALAVLGVFAWWLRRWDPKR